LQTSFANVPDPALDIMLVSGLALTVVADPDAPLPKLIEGHSHKYLTGKGHGHNNTVAHTGEPVVASDGDDSDDHGHDED